jgi:hypothetical protein
MIFSASRRTDIPAFYGEWMLNRLRAGEVVLRNPMNRRQVSVIQFTPANIDAIVFWTKNPAPFIKYLPEIDSLGYSYYFQFTITPYQDDIEKNIDKTEIIETFIGLSNTIGKEKVIWRYDPIFINDKYSMDYHIEHFEKIADQIHAYTEKCVISFVDQYSFLDDNFKKSRIKTMTDEQKHVFARNIGTISSRYSPKLEIATCCEEIDPDTYGFRHNSCIDGELIARINKQFRGAKKDPSQRRGCGCVTSRDIGVYNTCRNGCVYCYARRKTADSADNGDNLSVTPCPGDKVKIIDLDKIEKKRHSNTQYDFNFSQN